MRETGIKLQGFPRFSANMFCRVSGQTAQNSQLRGVVTQVCQSVDFRWEMDIPFVDLFSTCLWHWCVDLFVVVGEFGRPQHTSSSTSSSASSSSSSFSNFRQRLLYHSTIAHSWSMCHRHQYHRALRQELHFIVARFFFTPLHGWTN